MMPDAFSRDYLEQLQDALARFPHASLERLITAMFDAYREHRRLFILGNGGSATTAAHWTADLNKGCGCAGGRFKAICLSESIPTMLAYANDMAYEDVFVEQLKNFFEPGDLVIGISSSGNSPNVLKTIEYANRHQGVTTGLCGFSGGKLHSMVRIPLLASARDTQKVEDIHLIMAHITMQGLAAMIMASQAQT